MGAPAFGRFKKDAKIRAAIEKEGIERECRTWMGLGNTYRNAGLIAKCIPHYQRIIDVYPGSTAARKAAAILKSLQND